MGIAGRPRTHLLPLVAPEQPSAPGMTFIYLIKSLHLIKIGKATNLYLRLSNIRVDNPHSPELLRYWEVPVDLANRVDRFSRSEMPGRHVAGDWHEVSAEEAIATVEKAIGFVNEMLHEAERRSY